MPANYTYFDAQGQERTIYNVLDPKALSGVATNVTSGTENLVTVTTTEGLFPGMAVAIPNIPQGAFIHAIRSSTIIELWATAWNATTGVFTTSAANANATAAATGLTGHALGFSPRCIVSLAYAMGTWRNTHTSNVSNQTAAWFQINSGSSTAIQSDELLAHQTFGKGAALIPTAGTVASGVYTPTAFTPQFTDELATVPLKRHNGELWGVYLLVSSLGHISNVQAIPGREILYLGAST